MSAVCCRMDWVPCCWQFARPRSYVKARHRAPARRAPAHCAGLLSAAAGELTLPPAPHPVCRSRRTPSSTTCRCVLAPARARCAVQRGVPACSALTRRPRASASTCAARWRCACRTASRRHVAARSLELTRSQVSVHDPPETCTGSACPGADASLASLLQIYFDKMLTKSPFKSNCCSPYHCCGCLNLCGEVAVLAPCDGCNGCPCMIMFPCFMDFYPGLQDAQAFVDFIIVAREDFKQRKRACARAGTCVLRVARAPPCRAAGADARLCRVDAQRSRRAPACSTPSAARKRAVHRVPSAA